MAKRHVTKEALKAMANLSGLDLSDEKLEELLPQVQRNLDDIDSLDLLNLADVDSAIAFKASRE